MSVDEICRRYGAWIALALILLAFLSSVASIAHQNVYSSAWDQGAYLRLGLQIRHRLALADGNRHPLYPLLLAPMARPEIAYFTAAKVVSIALGLLGLLATYLVARQVVGPAWAVAAVLLVAMNTHYCISAGYVDVEVVLVPLTLIAWYWAGRAIQGVAGGWGREILRCAQNDHRFAQNDNLLRRDAFLAGLTAGLAYLAKGTGMLIAVAFGLALLGIGGLTAIWRRAPHTALRRSFASRFFASLRMTMGCFAGGFVLLAAPLWAYNWVQYGNPLFNVNTTHIMWLDNWPSRFTYAAHELPTFFTYVQTHSLAEAASRLANGLVRALWQWYHAGHPFWFPDQPAPWLVWACWGAGLLLLGGVMYSASRRWPVRRGWFLFSLAMVALFYATFAWYTPVDDSPRFVLPMIPVAYLALIWLLREVSGLAALARPRGRGLGAEARPRGRGLGAEGRRWVPVMVPAACVAVSLIAAGVYAAWHAGDLRLNSLLRLVHMPAHDREQNVESVRFMEVLLQRTRPGDAVLLGPTLALAEWIAFDRQMVPIPYVRQDWRTFSTWMVENDVRHAVLDYESWDLRRPLLTQYWGFQDGLVASELPAGWDLVYPLSFPCNPCLFSFDGQSVVTLEPAHATDVQYGGAFTLLGYDLVLPSEHVGRAREILRSVREPHSQNDNPLRCDAPGFGALHRVSRAGNIVLYWQAAGPVADDIHVFVHLVDEHGNLAGQHDGVMAQGRLPAHTLMPGMIVRDNHPLPDLPTGTYALYAGMYRWETLERLPALQQGRPVPNAYPRVGEVVVSD